MDPIPNQKQKKKNKSKKSRISFDEEFITKDAAVECLNNNNILGKTHNKEDVNHNKNSFETGKKTGTKRKKHKLASLSDNSVSEQGDEIKMKIKSHKQNGSTKGGGVPQEKKMLNKSITEELENATIAGDIGNDLEGGVETTKKTKRKRKLENEAVGLTEETTDDKVDPTAPKKQPEESRRAQKRKKYSKLLEEKKLQSLLSLQQKSLNYLSQWKHNRAEWKFEKLRQVWLSQNMFDTARIPDEFWNTVVEYFSGSRGKVRDAILKNAGEIVEKDSGVEEGGETEGENSKIKRARDIIKNLQT